MPETSRRITKLLEKSQLFSDVSADVLLSLAQQMELITINSGDILIEKGEIGDCLYILAHGRMRVYADKITEKPIGEVGVGDVVGELALLADTPRTATVRAVRDCTLIKISRTLFKTLVEQHPNSAMKIISTCVKRFLPNHSEKKHHIKTLAIMPCQNAVETQQVTEKLQKALSEYARVNVVSGSQDGIDQLMQKPNAQIQDQLNSAEQQFDITLYVADHDCTAWTMQCIRQADKILLVSMSNSFASSDAEKFVHKQKNIIAEKILLIVHNENTKLPQNTRDLIQKKPCDQHFHAAKNKDYERLARFLLGKAICVVLSGGGIRGLAHHGLVKAFEERNIPIDMVAGTSFGALMAMAVAKGMNQVEMNQAWSKLVKKIDKVVDLTFPISAISSGKVLHQLLTEIFPAVLDVEDLWLPAFSVATNISDFSVNELRTGPVWRAIRASLSIPGIFPPIIDDGDLLVDGASLNNLPVDLMHLVSNDGTVIASVASSIPAKQTFTGSDSGISGWRILLDSITNNKKSVMPNIAEVLVNSSLVASTRHELEMKSIADFTFNLKTDEFKLLDIENWEKIRDRGYESVCKELDEKNLNREAFGL